MSIREQAEGVFLALSILLVFVSLLFTLRYPEITQDLIPEDLGEKQREKRRRVRELKTRLVSHLLPVVVGSVTLVWLLAPLTIDILGESQLDLWGFDVVLSAVVLVELWVLGLAIWSSILTIRMIRKIRGLNEQKRRDGS
jgi:hypothetical protein